MTPIVATLYRLRAPMFYIAVMTLGFGAILRRFIPDGPVDDALRVAAWLAVVALVIWVLVIAFGRRTLVEQETQTVCSPVAGRWLALNSPASNVPSHGTRGYGQAYAVDLVLEPVGAERPSWGRPGMRRNDEFPAFGEAVHAMADGVVVSASDWRRDHRSRTSTWALAYLILEGMFRELGGAGFIVGNHVTIRTEEGTYALVAHLKRSSVTVQRGDVVRAGQRIGSCGNSGNSSEPHVHAQLMDRKSLWTAAGVPMVFTDIRIGEASEPTRGMPVNEEHMIATVA